ncbi:MAG: asparagine synthase (glutamine-hydrolyzing) [Actinomycetota bacterium]|nr:asparagine synthase (glutamine-hydrolyzing) [Actinomycetota bacterium]
MCGIAGLIDLAGRPIDAALLARMTDVLAHRGPDGRGLLLARPAGAAFDNTVVRTLDRAGDAAREAVVGLGSRRLAIIDTSERGLQPMVDRTGSVALVFNGELYNFRDLRRELEARGCTFSSGTDTEVFLAAYLAWGDGCLDRTKGMFGFALWDGRTGRLLIARDRFGIKPLYYTRIGDRVAFASEIKALLEAPWLPRIAHDDAVTEFLVHGNCDFADRTVLRHVHSLPPGHKLVVDLGRRDVAVSRYYALRVDPDGNVPDAEKLEQLRDLLERSVRDHLVSDVPVGSCLSGGIDSSSVVGLMGKILREQPDAATSLGGRIHTFTSSYDDDPSVDERRYALPVAGAVDAETHLVFPTPQDFVEQFPKMTYHFDMPFGTLSFYAQWCVMRAAKEAGMTVMLDGQGGDEVFGGYGKFRYGYLASLLRSGRVPTLAREAAAMVRQGDRYLLDIRNGYRYLPSSVRRRLGVDSLLARSLRPGLAVASAATSNPATRWWANARARSGTGDGGLTAVQRLQVDDITLDTLPQLLRYEDRSSMAFSIEARVPFLDHEVVEFGLSLPDHLKISGGWSKYALRQSLQGVLPDLVRTRKTKLGFAAPDQRWLSTDLRPFVLEMLSGELRSDRYVDGRVLRRDYAATAGRKVPTEAYLGLFRAVSLEMWMRTFEVSCE